MLLKKPSKLLSISVLLCALTSMSPEEASASAWLNDEGKTTLTVSPLYTTPYKSSSTTLAEDDAANTSNYTISNKTSYIGMDWLLEYGLTQDVTLIGEITPNYYNDRIGVTSSFNGGPARSFSLRSRYYDIDSNFGYKERLYSEADEIDIFSYQVLIYPGNFIIKDKLDYLSKKFAGQFSLLYGHAFNLPFAEADWPQYENYLDLEVGYKGYPTAGKHEGILNAELGIKPFGGNPLMIVGLLNTFNQYDFTKRPFNRSSISSGVNGLGVTPELASIIEADISSNLSQQETSPSHQLNFQLGFTLDPSSTLYLKSFHNVIKGKPFTFNTYFVSFEYKF